MLNKLKSLLDCISEWKYLIKKYIEVVLKGPDNAYLENMALRMQIIHEQQEVEKGRMKQRKITPAFRQVLCILHNILPNWQNSLFIVKPDTVRRWHRDKTYKKIFSNSKKSGRPPIAKSIINLILKFEHENPLISAEKIRERLLKLNIIDTPCPKTIRKYTSSNLNPKKPPTKKQLLNFKAFLRNYSFQSWGMDFFTVPTLTSDILYVLVIISHGRRKIEHFAVTDHPTADWTKQQIRNATFDDHKPKYLFYDNDNIFTSQIVQDFIHACGIKSVKTAHKSPWQNPFAERVIGTLRYELLNQIIPINQKHLQFLLSEYINKYYNVHRTHESLDGDTPMPSPSHFPTYAANTNLKATPILGGLYHTYTKVA